MEIKSVMLWKYSVRLVTSQDSAIPISSISLNIVLTGGKKVTLESHLPNFRAGSESFGYTKGVSFCYCPECVFSCHTELCLSQKGLAVPDVHIVVDAVMFRILKLINLKS